MMETIGWIGLGLMGSRMLPHLQAAGHPVVLYARNRAGAEPFVAAGARVVGTPAEVAAAADVSFTIVSMPADVEAVHFRSDGLLAGVGPGSLLVDMTTSSPELAARIAEAAEAAGGGAVDAPVSGGPPGAERAALSIMVGGRPEAVEAIRPILARLGRTIVHHGPAGAGQSAKIANQIAVGISMLGISEAFLFARARGLHPEAVLQTLRAGIVGSSLLDAMWPRIAAGDLEPGFRVEHLIKDLGLALEAGHQAPISLQGTALVKELYHAVVAAGHSGKGTQALITAIDRRWNAGAPREDEAPDTNGGD